LGKKQGEAKLRQGIGVYFFKGNIPRKTAYFKEKIHREVAKVE
jgi:hypothetical protein